VTFNGELAYVACGFGIVVFDLGRQEVKDTYYIGANGNTVNVSDIAFYNGHIYAASNAGIYHASLDSPNLANYSAWSIDTSLIHPYLNYNEIESFGDKLIANYSGGFNKDTMFVYNGEHWDYFNKTNTTRKMELRAYDQALITTNNYNVSIYNTDLIQITNIYNPLNSGITPNSTAMDSYGNYWIGDSKRGLIKTADGWGGELIQPNGPNTKSVFELQSCGDQVWIATGGHTSDWGKRYLKEGVFHFDGSWWTNLTKSTIPQLDSISDFVCTAINPTNPNETFVGLWGNGLIKFKDDQFDTHYSKHNSTLDVWLADQSLVNVSGLAFDSKNNLWVANTGANNLLSVLEPNGTWHSYNLGGTNSGIDISTMIVDKNDYKWIMKRNSGTGKIIVFDDNGTLDNTSDDRVALLDCNAGQGGISGNTVYCMAVDQDGAVWIGTDSGPCVFYDSKKIFNSNNYDASKIMIPRNDGTGQADPLFKEIKVLSMAVDGGNNKWFGTEAGVFLMSPTCLVQKHNFTTDNSPLLDNSVFTMAIDKNGEVFFGTDNGVISYRSESSTSEPTNDGIVAFPNPVRPGYAGFVGIKGLMADVLVKITTVDGAFVTQLRAEGGQAVWDCCTIDGQKVRPGIYFVFVSTDDGLERMATKILVMN
jgi:Two component regulator propeller.